MTFIKLFKNVFHFFIVSNLGDTHLFEQTNTLLHSFIQTDIFSCEFVLVIIITIHDGVIFVVVGSGPDGFKSLFKAGL